MRIRFYRNSSSKPFGHGTLPTRLGPRKLHLLWLGPLFVLTTPYTGSQEV